MAYCHQDVEPLSTPPGLLGGFWGPEGDISDSPGPEGLGGRGEGKGGSNFLKSRDFERSQFPFQSVFTRSEIP